MATRNYKVKLRKDGANVPRRKNHYTTVNMAPCKICGGKSTGYHFGVVSCEACKAFFRRALSRKSYKSVTCSIGGNCGTDITKLPGCTACRLKRCQELGMSKTGARKGRYSMELRTKAILEAKREQFEREGKSSPPEVKVVSPRMPCFLVDHLDELSIPEEANEIPCDEITVNTESKTNEFQTSKQNEIVSLKFTDHVVADIFLDENSFKELEELFNDKSFYHKERNDELSSYEKSNNISDKTTDSPLNAVYEFNSNSTEYTERVPDVDHGHTNDVCHQDVSKLDFSSIVEQEEKGFVALLFDDEIDMNEIYETSGGRDLKNHPERRDIHGDQQSPQENNFHENLLPRGPDEDVTYKEALIQRLVGLQEMVFPDHKVTDEILQSHKKIEDEFLSKEDTYRFLFGKNQEYASAEEVRDLYERHSVEIDDRFVVFKEKGISYEKNLILYILHSRHIPLFDRIDVSDMAHLLKASYTEFWIVSNFSAINGQNGVAGGTNGVLNAHKKVLASLFSADYINLVFTQAEALKKLHLTRTEISLIRVIVLTFTDRYPLKYPERVQAVHDVFVDCLCHHVTVTTKEPGMRLAKIIARLVEIRRMTHENAVVNKKFLKEWEFLMKDFPLWKEMMNYSISLSEI